MVLTPARNGFHGPPEGAISVWGDRLDFDRRVRMKFRGVQISSDSSLLVMRGLDDALGLSDLAATALRDTRRGKNTVNRLEGLLRQSVFCRLAGYKDVNFAYQYHERIGEIGWQYPQAQTELAVYA